MNWNEIVDKVTPCIVKIETPQGYGTGFLCLFNDDKGWCGIATANHVIEHAEKWAEPIRISCLSSDTTVLLKEADRVIFADATTDSAVILVPMGTLKFPENLIPLRPIEQRLPIGAEVGWLGYPGIGTLSGTLCFFAGNVSAWQDARRSYLIDGVTIMGSSGGPVIYSTPADGVQIVGAVAAYIVNRATGESLPGLSVAQDVSHFHEVTRQIRSIDEARKKKAELEKTPQPASTLATG